MTVRHPEVGVARGHSGPARMARDRSARTGQRAIGPMVIVPTGTGLRAGSGRVAIAPLVTVPRDNALVVTGPLEIAHKASVRVVTGLSVTGRKDSDRVVTGLLGIAPMAIAPARIVDGRSDRAAAGRASLNGRPGRRAAKDLRLAGMTAVLNARAAASLVVVLPGERTGRLGRKAAGTARRAASEGLLAVSVVTDLRSRVDVRAGSPRSGSRAAGIVPVAAVIARADRVGTDRARRPVDAPRAQGADPRCA